MNYDVIIVGGGPSGSTLASLIGGKVKTLLLDKAKFPRDKTCGDAVSGKTLSMLKELKLVSKIEKAKHKKIYGITFSSPNGTTTRIPIKKNILGKNYGYVCKRIIFDDILFKNASKKCDAIQNFTVTDLVWENGRVAGVKGILKGKEKTFKGKIIVGADGAQSIVAQKLKVNTNPPEHVCIAMRAYYKNVKGLTDDIEIHFVDELIPGYFWIFPAANGEANVGIGVVLSEVKKRNVDLKQVMFKILKENKLFKKRFENAVLTSEVKGWTLPFASYKRKIAGDSWILLGDAASLVDPFSGEGMGNGTLSARIAAPVVIEAIQKNNPAILKKYPQKLWQALGPEVDTSYKMQKLGRSKLLLNLVIGKVKKSEWVREQISNMLVESESKKNFTSPLFYLKLLLA